MTDRDLQARLLRRGAASRAGRRCRASTPPARTPRSSTSSAAPTRRACACYTFKRADRTTSSRTTSSGATTQTRPAARDDPRLQPLALRGRAGRARQGPGARRSAGARATTRSTTSSACSRASGTRSSSSSCTSPRTRSSSASASGSSARTSTTSSRPTTSRERRNWDAYQRGATRTPSRDVAPLGAVVRVPSDHKWYRNLVVARIVRDARGDGPVLAARPTRTCEACAPRSSRSSAPSSR